VTRLSREVPGRLACFHAHLAAEKALKALIVVGVRFPRIHDLVALGRLTPPA
jgi:HEPN domain-containing protein